MGNGTTMGKNERRRGIRAEIELVNLLRKLGVDARRQPLSGAMSSHPGDVVIPSWFGEEPTEVKYGRSLSALPWRWLNGRSALFMRRPRAPWIVVLPLDTLVEIMEGRSDANA